MHNHRGHQRHAVTLIEVLMSTLVISLGIMGLLALIPLGNHLANRGLEADRVSSLGQRIYREARTRGALNPDNWNDPVQGGGAGTASFLAAGEVLPARQPYLIDPTYFVDAFGAELAPRNEFPSQTNFTGLAPSPSPPQIGQIRRISLSRIASGDDHMPLTQANLAFASSDQLAFERPKATDDPLTNTPRQQFYLDSTTPIKRQIQRPFSWMMMLVPEPIVGLTGTPPFDASELSASVGSATDQYNMSTIIMRNRQVSELPDAFPDPLFNEYVVDRDEQVFMVDSYSFGEVTLRMPTVTPTDFTPEEIEDIMDLARGSWICLGARIGTATTAINDVHKWYRVQSVDEIDFSNNTLNISIQGPDWDYSDIPRQAIYIRSVVGVYERKVRLESLSKWTP
ncbi:MAG: type IV pilus modification PilV family protein [Pirellulales bacterium]